MEDDKEAWETESRQPWETEGELPWLEREELPWETDGDDWLETSDPEPVRPVAWQEEWPENLAGPEYWLFKRQADDDE